MKRKAEAPKVCAHPGCQSPGLVRVTGSAAYYCFSHKPIGRMK